jgi:hypothetical protein
LLVVEAYINLNGLTFYKVTEKLTIPETRCKQGNKKVMHIITR